MLGKLFGLGVQVLRPVLPQGLGRFRSEVHLQLLQGLVLVILLAQPFGDLPLKVGIDLGLNLELVLYKSQSPVLCSRYIHNFSIIDGR